MITSIRILSRRWFSTKFSGNIYSRISRTLTKEQQWGSFCLASAIAASAAVAVTTATATANAESSIDNTDSNPSSFWEPHRTFAQASSHSTHFQLQAALEFKEEFQKVKLARFLNELTQLAAKTRGGSSLQKYQTEWPVRRGMDLHGINLAHLTTGEALYLIDKIQNGERMEVQSLIELCWTVAQLLKMEPTLVDKRRIETVVVVGDLHGSLPSLQMVLELVGDLDDPNRCIVFDGDFVDRGDDSLEVLMTLLLLKIAYPKQVVLVRGNHEDSMVAKVYGFSEELKQKYSLADRAMEKLWKSMSETFAALPLGVVTDTAFIVHGGLPSKEFRLDDLRKVTVEQRCQCHTLVQATTPLEKMIESLLWSDPSRRKGIHPSPRGTGVKFGHDVAKEFLTQEKLKYIVRGHEPAEHGILEMECGGDGMKVITVFSAANYPNEEGNNMGAILNLTSDGNAKAIKFHCNAKKSEDENLLKSIWGFAGHTEKSFLSLFGASFVGSSHDKLRSFVTDHQSELARAFKAVEKDGMITKQQWISVMQKVLDLPGVRWERIQPQVTPPTEPKGDFINWREYLIENTTGIVEALSDKEKMGDTVDHMDKMLVIFEYLDFEKNGVVGRQEFIAGTRILNRLHLPKRRQIKDPDALFAQFDDHGNGWIGLQEFQQHLSHSHLLSSMTSSIDKQQAETLAKNHDLLKMAFEFLDRDGSGTITFEKWKVGIELLNKQLGPDEKVYDANELFTLMDVHGTGSIDLDEFNELFGSL